MGTVLELSEDNDNLSVEDHHPKVDPTTGAWELSNWDLECISIGAGILGCGGGGHPYTGKILAKSKLKEGKKMMVVTPER